MRNPSPLGAALLLSLFWLGACGGSNSTSEGSAPANIDAATTRAVSLSMACSGCHADPGGAIVSLNGYDATQMRETLTRYRDEIDGTTVMHRLARGYSDEDIDLISEQLGRGEDAP